ncbi:Outer membrane protein assembly factor BamB, contains PQQ-like beta-propeller repeat [Sulfobacillus thermosulfidooxidans DSM 9293]|uniref:Outer membrane protein assembly factor BamB, contains PQQ-like beta-propeller repeat n=1 Tax=Sulfobacillus thermosulfidooxidans (strain DSM 9293 / VKM B-1269 / AT-1) TaxID=929705 RepID=A0A1W1WDD8_SULTA|nr:PQQ-binding-like beta-propeller repeat protein [Sulfobacillus thermosulfidooxidans]SMC04235.1 Outer membrane protein assembly factor BamB, contains PQQ-like beta-propeller repeat [Sulfobacillus thermosulfidooxidans DSM 9293]
MKWHWPALVLGLAAIGTLGTFGITHSENMWPQVADQQIGASEWNMFGTGPSHDAVIENGPNQNLSVKWTRQFSQPLMQPSVVRGVVYVGGIGNKPAVYAIDAKTGKTLWKTDVNNQVMTTPVVHDGIVFVGSGNHNFPISHVPQYGVQIIRGNGPSAIYALDARTGAILWKHETQGEDMPTFVYANHLVYVANGSDELLALSPLTGQTVWKLSLPSYVSMSSPTIVGNMMYFGGTHPAAIYAINLQTHQVQWMHTLPHPLGGSDDVPPAAADGMIYFDYVQQVHNEPHEVVYALNAQNGHTVWTVDEGAGTIPVGPNGGPRDETGIPTIYGNRLYVSSPLTDSFYAFNLQTGALDFSVHFKSQMTQGPVIYQGVCYVGDVHGNFYAINATTGKIQGKLHFQGAFMPSTPVLVGQTLFIGDKAGQFMAIPLSEFAS